MSVYVDIEKRLGNFLLKVNFTAENETVALLGASGSGKSMTLKCIAGIEKPDRGKILVDGTTLFDSEQRINLSPQQRKTGLMFQNYALFPNMTVEQNLLAGANREKNKLLRKERVNHVMEIFGLQEFAKRLPSTLSGGQQQRVALARMLISEPKILLLDEPFSALDSHLRLSLEQEVRQVIREFGKTVILVSHDKNEVYRMSDRVAIMKDGRLEEYDKKYNVFQRPSTLSAAKMIGCENLIPVEMAAHYGLGDSFPDTVKYIGIRASDIACDPSGDDYRVTEIIENPAHVSLCLQSIRSPGAFPLTWNQPTSATNQLGEIVKILIPADKLLFLQDGSERKLL